MEWLSEESLLLAKNWDTVEDIFRAEKRLREEMSSFLLSLEQELVQQDWWDEDWTFVRYRDNQVFISCRNWRIEDKSLVWIGVWMFDPERVFGTESPPSLYVWVGRKQYDLAQMLAEAIEEDEDEVLGEIDHRTKGYVVKHALQKCLPGEVDGYADLARQQIIDFFAYYAKLLRNYNGLIQDRIEKIRSGLLRDEE
jgi:hypothetical protein